MSDREDVIVLGMPRWAIGVVLSCIASIISNLGINLQKLCHVRSYKNEVESPRAPTTASVLADIPKKRYFLQPLWVSGITLIAGGALCDFFALAFAPQVVVAPLGSVTLIANVFFAPLLLGEKITRLEIASVCLIISGSIISVWFAAHEDKSFRLDEFFALFRKPAFIVFAICTVITVIIMVSAIRHYNQMRIQALLETRGSLQTLSLLQEDLSQVDTELLGDQSPVGDYYQNRGIKVHRFLYPALSGIIGGQNVLFAKCTAVLLYGTVISGRELFKHIPLYLMVFCLATTIFFQIKFLNDGLRLFEASYVVPVFQTFWCLGSVAPGMIFFEEYQNMKPFQMGLFFVGITVTVSGLSLLSKRDASALPGSEPVPKRFSKRPPLAGHNAAQRDSTILETVRMIPVGKRKSDSNGSPKRTYVFVPRRTI